MELFIDTANLDEIREAASWGIIDGCTTNPSLIAREGRDFAETIYEICEIVQILAGYCPSTALSFAMHSHPVCVNVFKHGKGDDQATGALQKIAQGELLIAGTGANDWLMSSGEAVEVDGSSVGAACRVEVGIGRSVEVDQVAPIGIAARVGGSGGACGLVELPPEELGGLRRNDGQQERDQGEAEREGTDGFHFSIA